MMNKLTSILVVHNMILKNKMTHSLTSSATQIFQIKIEKNEFVHHRWLQVRKMTYSTIIKI